MRREKKRTKISIVLVLLLTVFFVSFSTTAFVIINANKLVFVDNYEQYKSIMDNMKNEDNKDAKIVDLEEQVERYKGLYESVSEENRALISANSALNKKLNNALSNQQSNAITAPVTENQPTTENSQPSGETLEDSKNTEVGEPEVENNVTEEQKPDTEGINEEVITEEINNDEAVGE